MRQTRQITHGYTFRKVKEIIPNLCYPQSVTFYYVTTSGLIKKISPLGETGLTDILKLCITDGDPAGVVGRPDQFTIMLLTHCK